MPRNNPGKFVGNSQYGDYGKLCSELLAIWLQNHRILRILDVALPFNLEPHPVALRRSADQLEQLVGKQGDDPEHEMKRNFFRSPNHHVPGPELFFQPAVEPLCYGSLPVSHSLM